MFSICILSQVLWLIAKANVFPRFSSCLHSRCRSCSRKSACVPPLPSGLAAHPKQPHGRGGLCIAITATAQRVVSSWWRGPGVDPKQCLLEHREGETGPPHLPRPHCLLQCAPWCECNSPSSVELQLLDSSTAPGAEAPRSPLTTGGK